MSTRVLIVNNIKLSINASFEEAFSIAKGKLKKHRILPKDAHFSIYRRSIDARNKSDIYFVYSVSVTGEFSDCIDKALLSKIGASFDLSFDPKPIIGSQVLDGRPVIVGSGPCGLFCALMLAEYGYNPIIIERGGCIEDRISAVKKFKASGILDSNTNIQFGAGGAGTFSDGKLVTRINDGLSRYVLSKFVEFGAPEEILYISKPHVGTDVLCNVISNLIHRIKDLGGDILYNTRFIGTGLDKGIVRMAQTTAGPIATGALILAIGHSSRDTYRELLKSGVSIDAKNFSVGMRIEHLRENIDRAMFGENAGNPNLSHAEYNLSYDTKNRGVYTFCMCPGGEVVAATSEEGGVVVNGMSYHARDGRNSNSAVVCSVFKEDYGADPMAAIDFQREIEQKAFRAAGGGYYAPIITVADFIEDKLCHEPSSVIPSYLDWRGVNVVSPKDYLPGFIIDPIKNAIQSFDKKIKGFADSEAILTGAETRTSAPLRILRNDSTHLAIGYDNLYPAGEGAGYAGGITSAAIDGIKVALSVMERYAPLNNG